MDRKPWIWRKKSSEKTIVATDKVDVPVKQIEEKIKMLPTEKELESEITVKNLNQKLASVLFDCDAKEVLVMKHVKIAEEAIAGREKLEAEGAILKQELDEALRHGAKTNERLTNSDAALKEHSQQLKSLREEQEQRICDAISTTTKEFEKAQKILEEKLTETNKRLANVAAENTRLNKALLFKEKMIEDLQKSKAHAEAECGALMTRLDSTEKENAFLKYEFQMLEKEFDIRNVEIDFCRRSADAAHKQHLESVRKVAKLEAECQRLRLLVRKRLPGPAALAKMKSEVEMLGRDQRGIRKMPNPARDLIIRDVPVENSPQIASLIQRLRDLEEENRTLKETITKKDSELHSSRAISSRTASRLHGPLPNELSLTSGFDICSDDGVSSSGSWANALISELEHFRNQKLKNSQELRATDVSELSLMDDFVEMEKLAIVAVNAPSGFSDMKQEMQSRNGASEKSFDWLQVVLDAMMKQTRVSKQSLDELLEDIRIALGYINHDPKPPVEPDHISGYITWKSPSSSPVEDNSEKGTSNQHIQPNITMSICKIIKLIEGFNPMSLSGDSTLHNVSEGDQSLLPLSSTPPAEYIVHVFQWRSSELRVVLQQFVHTCRNLLNGKVDLEKFVGELSFALDWIVNNYAADASSVRDKIKKHIGQSESRSENEVGEKEPDTVHASENVQCNVQDENRKLKDELKRMQSSKKDMETRLQSATDKSEALIIQLRESEQRIESLHAEMESLKESKGVIEDQIENQKLLNEDLDTQLRFDKVKLNEIFKKVSSLEVELEDRRNCCEDLEAKCLELQLQLESGTKKETQNHGKNQEEKQSQTGKEITAASLKLVECQETILTLGKQLKALTLPGEAALFDKVFSATSTTTMATNKNLSKHSTLYEQMLADDHTRAEIHKSLSKQEVCTPVVGHLAMVPIKQKGSGSGSGSGLLRKLLMRKKRNNKKPRSLPKV